MRIYATTAPGSLQWFPTKADAKEEARKLHGGAWHLVEVPTDKHGLLNFLSCHPLIDAYVAQLRDAQPLPAVDEPIAASPPVEMPTPRGRELLRQGRECDDLVEYILDADGFILSNLAGAVVERFGRLQRDAKALAA